MAVSLLGAAVVAPPAQARDVERISAESLRRTAVIAGAIDNAAFMPGAAARPAAYRFAGRLDIPATELGMSRELRRPRGHEGRAMRQFPALSISFVSHDGHLVPLERDIVWPVRGDSMWGVVFAPGRVWSEPPDGDWSRAAVPFFLVGRVWNQVHHGIATFLYNDRQISFLRLQIVQESASWAQFDAWAQVGVRYWPETGDKPVDEDGTVRAAFAAEVAARLPVRRLVDLVSADHAAAFDPHSPDITTSGLIVDGTIYARPCQTRHGDYPFCREMLHGVFSVTKTMGAALALLHLAQRYGDDVFDARIVDHLDMSTAHDGWRAVTFGDALNMATGIGDEVPRRVDRYVETDETRHAYSVFGAPSAADKLRRIRAAGNYPWGPGEVFRYRTADTITLALAMDAYVRTREGADTGLWDMLTRDVFAPIGVRHMPIMRTREPAGRPGVPFFGYGLYLSIDNAARIAALFAAGGRHAGSQLLSAPRLAETVPAGDGVGLATGTRIRDGMVGYHRSFWLMPYRGRNGCRVRIPTMMGIGGNLVAMMPNGVIGYRFADAPDTDSRIFAITGMARAAESVRPFCGTT